MFCIKPKRVRESCYAGRHFIESPEDKPSLPAFAKQEKFILKIV